MSAATPVCLVMRSLPRKMRPEQQKSCTYFCSPCFFPADSRPPPECTPHSKALNQLMRFWLRLFFSVLPNSVPSVFVIFAYYGHSGGGATLLETHEFRKWTAGPTSSALSGPNACIRRALCCVWSAATPVCLIMRSLPRKMRPEQQKSCTYFCSPCFFPADSRPPPECTPHSKALNQLMRF